MKRTIVDSFRFMAAIMFCLVVGHTARADMLTAEQNIFLRADGLKGTDQLDIKNNTPDHSFNRKAWFSFDISGALHFLTAELVLTEDVSVDGDDSLPESVFNIYGLTDESIDTWTQDSITYTNAPGNVEGSGSGAAVAPSLTMLVGSFMVTGAGTSGVTHSIDSTELLSFLNSDTDGRATFILVRQTADANVNGVVHTFQAIDSGNGPILNFTVPEPNSLAALIGIGSLILFRRRVV